MTAAAVTRAPPTAAALAAKKESGERDFIDALEATLVEKVQQYLANCVYDNARFLAERLVAHHRADENVFLLAKCYHHSGRVNQAIAVLEGSKRPQNRYLLAVCCFQQGKLIEAENALRGDGDHHFVDVQASEQIPNGAAGLYLMGRICRRANRREQAIMFFTKSLEMDTALWSAYEELCELGANIDAAQFFGASTYMNSDQSEDSDKTLDLSERDAGSDTDEFSNDTTTNTTSEIPCCEDEFATPEPRPLMALATRKGATSADSLSRFTTAANRPPPSHHSSFKTPGASSSCSYNPVEVVKKPRASGVAGSATPNPRARKTYRRPLNENDDESFRRNARLSFSSAVGEDATPYSKSSMAPETSVTPLAARLFHNEATPEVASTASMGRRRRARSKHEGNQQLLRLLSTFGSIYQKLSMYMCREALYMLEQLPAAQQASGWVQHQIGRAHFEMADYNSAHDVFKAMHRAEPYRTAGLDLYSTTLWHLKKEVELSYLAQQVTAFDKLSSEAWCVAGNCFSLQKEHDTALTFFQRAIQLNPSFTYAYTLSGHEYVANEDFEKAINCYRHAVRTDPRHYNAWYGLGTIYYRQEKFEFAEYHFKRALEINPRSSLLHCFLGMVLHSTRQFDEALRVLAIAGELQPLNPQARFQRANVLITQHRYEEALAELKIVRNFAPRESSVHFMMGKVAKKLGRVEDAMRFFTTALYFHPKDNNVIKSAIDKIHEPDLDDDDDRL
ncbi:Anaphase-promoting complex subunit [Globisporangium polare]